MKSTQKKYWYYASFEIATMPGIYLDVGKIKKCIHIKLSYSHFPGIDKLFYFIRSLFHI